MLCPTADLTFPRNSTYTFAVWLPKENFMTVTTRLLGLLLTRLSGRFRVRIVAVFASSKP
jgi:hypothetical protein